MTTMATSAAHTSLNSGQTSQRRVAAVVMTVVWPDGKDPQLGPPWNGKKPNIPSRIQDGLSPRQLSGHVRPKTDFADLFIASATWIDRLMARTMRPRFFGCHPAAAARARSTRTVRVSGLSA